MRKEKDDKSYMNIKNKQTMTTGIVLFFAGVFSLFLQINDEGLFAYVLLLFGVWEIGEFVSEYFFGDWSEDGEPRKWSDMIKNVKADAARITIPILLSMIVEMGLVGEGLRMYTIVAYFIALAIYLAFVFGFAFYEQKQD